MTKTAELKGSSFTLSVLRLHNADLDVLGTTLADKVLKAPSFFKHAPVVVDISDVSESLDFAELKTCINSNGMVIVGITGCKDDTQRQKALAEGLAIMNAAKSAAPSTPQNLPAMVVRNPVRSGQQIYAKNRDLVILNHVSAGAEVISDGSIHIYGVLRGRAIAGANGQTEAQIICQDIEAELVSISGQYWLSDNIPSEFVRKPVIVSLEEDTLRISHLAL
ncbi:septum site-determining protein MinC [Parasalinivibrio latis]|uniref:septum site-determining protein MinC n=1 Tax=Parasalinivibrio latis TaxID=2952610 RepID=UPI0030E205D0